MTPRTRWSVCTLCSLILVLALGLSAGRAQSGPSWQAPWQEHWLARFNRERLAAGAPPLRPSLVLTRVAQRQAEEMARDRRLRSPAAERVSEGLRQVGYSAHGWREVYAFSELSPEGDLLVTPPRVASAREALDGRFRDLGVGSAVVGEVTLHVFLFGWHQGDYFAAATARLHDRARIAAEMLDRVNDLRRRQGLPPLARSPLLDRVSQEHAEDMLLRGYSEHQSPEGLGPSERAWAGGYRAGIGENILEERFSVDEALKAWMGSPGHRRNILDPDSREAGLGLAVGGGYDAAPGGYRVIWVQSFGRGQ